MVYCGYILLLHIQWSSIYYYTHCVSEYNGLLWVYTTTTCKNCVSEYNGLLWVYTTTTHKNCVSEYNGLLWVYTILHIRTV